MSGTKPNRYLLEDVDLNLAPSQISAHLIRKLKSLPSNVKQVEFIEALLFACQEKQINLPSQVFRDIGMRYNHGQEGFPQDLALAFRLISFAASTTQRPIPKPTFVESDYSDVIREFRIITNQNTEAEKKLGHLMYQYCHKGKLVSLKDLQSINPLVTQANVDSVNELFYRCFVKDISTWMLGKETSERVPFATAQTNALWLIKEGFLSIEEVFSSNAPFGIFTSFKTENIEFKIKRINALYQKAILEPRIEQSFRPTTQYDRYRERDALNRKSSSSTKSANPLLKFMATQTKGTVH